MENPIKMDDLGVPRFWETSIWLWIYGDLFMMMVAQLMVFDIRTYYRRIGLSKAWVWAHTNEHFLKYRLELKLKHLIGKMTWIWKVGFHPKNDADFDLVPKDHRCSMRTSQSQWRDICNQNKLDLSQPQDDFFRQQTWDILLWYSAIWHDQHTPAYWMVLSVNTWWMVCMIQKSMSQKKGLNMSLVPHTSVGYHINPRLVRMIYATTDTGKACPAVKYGNASIRTVQIHTNTGDGVCSFCAMFESSPPVKYHTGPRWATWTLRGNKFLVPVQPLSFLLSRNQTGFLIQNRRWKLDGHGSNSTKITSSNTDAQMEVS